VISVLAECFEI